MQKTTRGFIQIPFLLLIIFGAMAVSAGGYYVVQQSTPAQKEVQKDTLSTEKQSATTTPSGVSISTATSQVRENQKGLGYKAIVPKEDILALKGELLAKLSDDANDFTTLLDSVRKNKEGWTKITEDAADQRVRSLDTLASGISNAGIKQFVVATANYYRDDKAGAEEIYNDLYRLFENAIVAQISTTTALKNEVWDTLPSQDLQDRAEKLLTDNNDQKTRFLTLAQKANDVAYSVETKKSDYYLQGLDGIRTLISSYATVASVNQQLLQIEQQAQQATTPKQPLQCWTTTETQGSIFSGKYTTNIQCNQ